MPASITVLLFLFLCKKKKKLHQDSVLLNYVNRYFQREMQLATEAALLFIQW